MDEVSPGIPIVSGSRMSQGHGQCSLKKVLVISYMMSDLIGPEWVRHQKQVLVPAYALQWHVTRV